MTFSLTYERGTMTPVGGEDMGNTLARAANLLLADMTSRGVVNEYNLKRVASLRLLAAQAFEAGSNVCLGHNRAERYCNAAQRLRISADQQTPINGTE
jgi:hypothetical protein